jgi:hypothetical protein
MKPKYCRPLAGRALLFIACSLLATVSFAADLKFLEEPGEGDYDVTGSLTVKSPAALDATLAFARQDKSGDCYLLSIRGGKATLRSQRGGKLLPLGNVAPLSLKAGQGTQFTLQRRAWRLVLIWDNTVVLRAYDRSLGDGKVGFKAAGGSWDDLRVQPVGDVTAADDFVREEGAASIWEPAVGTWEAKTLRDDEQAAREEADKSANAFSYFGSGLPHGITLAGNWFWDRYAFEAACRPMGRGAAGLVFYYQDENNYLVLRLTCVADPAPNGNKLQLVLVRNGKEQVLAERAGGYEPGQWYKLRVNACEDAIQCLVDDELRLQATTKALGQGQIGLYVEGKSGVFFDDVVSADFDLFRETFAPPVPGKWIAGAGFAQSNGVMTHSGDNSLCVTGPNWQGYTCAVDSALTGPGSAGLAFCYKTSKDYCLLRIVGGSAPKAQLVRMTDKGAAVLAEKPVTGLKHRLRVSVDNGLITGLVDEKLCLQAVVPGLTGGAIALSAKGKAAFDNLALSLVTPRKGSHVTKEFAVTDKHPEMAEWASTRGPWVKPAEGKDDWWSKGDYFGDTSVTFTIPAVGSKTGTARAIIGGEPGAAGAAKSGVVLTVAATEKSKKLTFTLSALDQPLKTAEMEVEGDAKIVYGRESGLLVVRLNDKPILTVQR